MRDRLIELCCRGLIEKGMNTEQYQSRVMTEMREIDSQNEHEYLLNQYDLCRERKVVYPENQNNLLVCYLLDIAPMPDMDQPPAFVMGEYPDIDCDFIKPVQVYLKDVWAPKTFGREYVCSIGNYTTFGLSSAFTDMARIFGLDNNEIKSLTTKLGLKDEDGKNLTFDKAMEEYPALKAYCDQHPELAAAVKRCLHRNRGMGKHAGGLIISNRRIDDLVPLVKDSEGSPLSAWVEGQHGQDLGPMGLIKFDVLVTTCLLQIATATKLIKERHGMDYLWSAPGRDEDWSDTSYIDDPKALELANRGDMLGVFQFDGFGIRNLCKGNVTRFDDMIAFNALYRPGPLNANMHTTYIRRKNGKEEYAIHPLLNPILGRTYGIYSYQEQIMRLLDVVGGIPEKDCLVVLKGISKKDITKFAKYKQMFIENGQKNLGVSEEEVTALWNDIEGFAAYSFNKSHSCAYAYLAMQCLCLKAHYPIEFFTATLSCEKELAKIKEYMIDAKKRGIQIRPIDINKSKANFSIGPCGDGEAIYYGFSKIKGIGEAVSKRIIENQPYASFDDFLRKMGPDAKVLPPLISVGAFGEGNRLDLFKFYMHFKDRAEKNRDRLKRNTESRKKHTDKLREFLVRHEVDVEKVPVDFSDEVCREWYEPHFSGRLDLLKELDKIRHTYTKCVDGYERKVIENPLPIFSDFLADSFEVEEKYELMYTLPIEESEITAYGFRWTHPLEKSPDYKEHDKRTFQLHRQMEEEGYPTGYVEVELQKVIEKPTKNGGVFYTLVVSDVLGEEAKVIVWQDDFERFSDMLVEGNLVKIMVTAPDNGFSTYKLDGPPKYLRHKLPKKDMDFRVIVYRRGDEPDLI